MPDISDFHPLVQDGLRTGRIPDNEAIARAVGKEPDEMARLRELVERKTGDENETDTEPEHPDAQRFRDRYHQLVEAMVAEWQEENPHAGKSIPTEERERIEEHCNRQIQGEWRRHLQPLDEQDEDELDAW